jgi:hypothetical protein
MTRYHRSRCRNTIRRLPREMRHVDGLGVVMTRGTYQGYPALTWGWANRRILATRRQLRDMGLAPGRGNDAVAVLLFGHRRPARRLDWARLYRIDLAVPKRTPTTAQLAAVRAALVARRTCTGPCRQIQPRCVSTTSRMCPTCETATNFWPRYAAEHGYTWEAAA